MKYKVGDKVRIRSKEWYDKHKDANGEIRGAFFDKDRAKLCGTIQKITNGGFVYGSGGIIYSVEDAYEFIGEEAIEGLVEEETKFGTALNPLEPKSNANCLTRERVDEMSLDKAGQITDFEYEGLAYTLPDGYQFVDENGNVINATKIVLEKKKKEYPKTHKEAFDMLGYRCDHIMITNPPKDASQITKQEQRFMFLTIQFQKLLTCRDAYWKIAGEEMGLGKPWKPSWDKCTGEKYCISRVLNTLRHDAVSNSEYHNRILAFPTEEMRDAFYENFKELIESCKELL